MENSKNDHLGWAYFNLLWAYFGNSREIPNKFQLWLLNQTQNKS